MNRRVKKLPIYTCEMCPYFEGSLKSTKITCSYTKNFDNIHFYYKDLESYKKGLRQQFKLCPLDDDKEEIYRKRSHNYTREMIECRKKLKILQKENIELKNSLIRLEQKINEVYKWMIKDS